MQVEASGKKFLLAEEKVRVKVGMPQASSVRVICEPLCMPYQPRLPNAHIHAQGSRSRLVCLHL